MNQLNYDFIEAPSVILPPFQQVEFWVIGCGGTGSFLVQLLARIASSLQQSGQSTRIILVDPDRIEAANLTRQCFCQAELGLNKAQALAARYGLAWHQLRFEAIPDGFKGHWLDREPQTLTLLMGCVDRAAGRLAIANALERRKGWRESASTWWIDAGNGDRHGQVLIGSSFSPEMQDYFNELGCLNLPAPSLQAPELVVEKREEVDGSGLSCEQLAMLNAQSLLVNVQAATLAAELALELVTGKLRRYGAYFDQATGSLVSRYIDRTVIEQQIKAVAKPVQSTYRPGDKDTKETQTTTLTSIQSQ